MAKKYIVTIDVFFICIDEVQESMGFIQCNNISPYIPAGTEVTLEDGMYNTVDGSSVPIEHCTVIESSDNG